MTTKTLQGNHPGELLAFQTLHLPPIKNPAHRRLPPPHAERIRISPLFGLSTIDSHGNLWATLTGGEPGFARKDATEEDVLVIEGFFGRGDPVIDVLLQRKEIDGEEGWPVGGCSVDPMTRDRVKLAGRVLGVEEVGGDESTPGGGRKVRIKMRVEECLGNCPKYITMREIIPAVSRHMIEGEVGGQEGGKVQDGFPLGDDAVRVIQEADVAFVGSTFAEQMDLNHRGGKPGFIRIEENTSQKVSIVWPEYSGNNLCQTLGNLLGTSQPSITIFIPSFSTSSAVYLSGTATVLIGKDAASIIPRSNLAIRLTVTSSRFIPDGLPFRGEVVEYSPYNPPLRPLASEGTIPIAEGAGDEMTARLVSRERLTPTINRYVFKIQSESGTVKKWHAGQYATLDFNDILTAGYKHMNDLDPQSLNEDFVRTFTVSSIPGDGQTFEITAKMNGKATRYLDGRRLSGRRHQDGKMQVAEEEEGLEIPVLGFGGLEGFRMKPGERNVFIAGGVGITPLLAQAPSLLTRGVKGAGDLKVLWSLRREDVNLAIDSFTRFSPLAKVTTIFLTGEGDGTEKARLEGLGTRVEERRVEEGDLKGMKGEGRGFYLCAGGALLGMVQGWVEGERVVWEEFSY